MRTMKRRLSAYMLTGFMLVSMCGCNAKPEPAEDASVLTPTEIETEAEEITRLAIETESFHLAFQMEPGESRQLDVDTDYKGSLEYLSSDAAIAAVDADGMVTALADGTVTMTVIAGNAKRTANVIVRTSELEAGEPLEEATAEQTAAPAEGSTPSGTVASAQTSGTTGNNGTVNTTAGSGADNTVVSAAGGTTPAEPAPTATEAPAFNPADYYLDWYYIQDQVNARLQADYPNCTIGASTWHGSGPEVDGIEGMRWTNESMIDNMYLYIKGHLTDVDSTYSGSMGMFVNSITVNPDGSRTISVTTYH
ncbi:MAG: Ig-like domain-containing protein [Bacteroides sp.]|nr:Ig-like domain-containing protein [Bacteroides sp.]MCM1549651.1 Ig-like domain-containing protein [Clostridium sp.]